MVFTIPLISSFLYLFLGGCIGVLNYMGAFNAAIAALSKVTKGKEYILIILITIIIAARWNYLRSCRRNHCTLPDPCTGIPWQPDMMLWFVSLQFTWDLLSEPCSRPSTRSLSETHPMQPGISLADGMGIRGVALVLGTLITLIYILRYAKKVKRRSYKINLLRPV